MQLMLCEPRYFAGFLGFYTDPKIGRQIHFVGIWLSLVAVGVALFAATSPGLEQSLFLVASAWLVIAGLMRMVGTGIMWVIEQVADWIGECLPRSASLTEVLKRGYWIVMESFLSIAFIGTLVVAILVGCGFVSLDGLD